MHTLVRQRFHQKANRAARLIADRPGSPDGVGAEWANPSYGNYMTSSAAIHAAVRVRSDAVASARLLVLRRPGHNRPFEMAGDDNPVQMLLDRPNRHWSRGDLWHATETYMLIWGSAFWGLERDTLGHVSEIWPLRPDNMRVRPDPHKYIRGYVYTHGGEQIGYLPEEIAWFRRFNPLDEFSGLSSVAPARLAVDMARQAMRFNNGFFANSAMPSDLAVTVDQQLTEEEMNDFLERWDSRFHGTGNAHRPAVLTQGMDVKRLGIAQRDMEFLGTLDWNISEVSRAFSVPKVFLSVFEDATHANVNAMERFLWRNAVVPELRLFEDTLTRSLLPLFESFPGEYAVKFDLSDIEALRQDEYARADREVALINAGVLKPSEVRSSYGLPDD